MANHLKSMLVGVTLVIYVFHQSKRPCVIPIQKWKSYCTILQTWSSAFWKVYEITTVFEMNNNKHFQVSTVVFWVVKLCSLVGDYHVSEECIASTFRVKCKDGGNMFLQNFGDHLQDHTASQARRPHLISSPPSEP
jgi:hypothetical protein